MKTTINLSPSQFKSQLQKCSGKTVVLDTETTGLQWWTDHLTTVGFFCPEADICGSIDIASNMELEHQVQEIVSTALAPNTIVICHNAKFDWSFMGVDPQHVPWRVLDTTVMIHLYDSRLPKGLEAAEKLLLGTNSKREHIDDAQFAPVETPIDPKTGKKQKGKLKIWQWNPDKRQVYCINDTRVTYQLAETLMPQLKQLGLYQMLAKEMSYMRQIYYTEHLGVLLDQEFVGRALLAMERHEKDLEQQLMDACGHVFNWRSNEQLSKALYEGLGIAKPVNPFAAEKGSYKTKLGFERVKELRGGMYNKTMTSTFLLMEKVHHPLGELLASLREASKLKKTLSKWLELVDDNSVIHSSFNLTGTRTGRLSSRNPNLCNVASEVRSRFTQGLFSGGITRTEEYNLRHAFIARPGYGILSIDYRQMEMRFFGIDSGDENLLAFLKSGKDIHLMIALKVWGDCGEKENKIHREWSKTIAFGLIYGMTTGSLEHKLGMTRIQAAKVIDDYWTSFPRIRPWLFETVATCKEHGYLRYWSGRIWREGTEMFMYKGANAKVQGGCADLLSVAAMRTHKWLHEHDAGDIISYIYDELLMEIREEKMEETANAIAKIMQVPDLFGLPFLTDCKVGHSYGDLVEMTLDENGVWHMPELLSDTRGSGRRFKVVQLPASPPTTYREPQHLVPLPSALQGSRRDKEV